MDALLRLIVLTGAMLLLGCSEKEPPPPSPFEPKIPLKLSTVVRGDRALDGSGFSCFVWDLGGSKKEIVDATSSQNIRNALVWSGANGGSFDKALNFLDHDFKEFNGVRPTMQELLGDAGSRAAFRNLYTASGGIYACEIWICSPESKKLLFISAKF